MEQRARQLGVWVEPFVNLRIPKMFNLRRDPFERADLNSNTYWDWVISHEFLIIPAQDIVAEQIQSLKEFPPRQKPSTFNLDKVLQNLQDASGGSMH
jgi:arylsulfatase